MGIRRSRKHEGRALQDEEKFDAILDIVEALADKLNTPIPDWIKRKTYDPDKKKWVSE